MSKHKDVYIHSSNLITLLLVTYTDDAVARMIDCECETDEDGVPWVQDPDCWYRVAWPDHVITPSFNGDATYHPIEEEEVREIVRQYNQIYSNSIRHTYDW